MQLIKPVFSEYSKTVRLLLVCIEVLTDRVQKFVCIPFLCRCIRDYNHSLIFDCYFSYNICLKIVEESSGITTSIAEVWSEPIQTTKTEVFVKIVNSCYIFSKKAPS